MVGWRGGRRRPPAVEVAIAPANENGRLAARQRASDALALAVFFLVLAALAVVTALATHPWGAR